jgi:hypothetical protein
LPLFTKCVEYKFCELRLSADGISPDLLARAEA